MTDAGKLAHAIIRAGVPIDGVRLNHGGWEVTPPSMQGASQGTIDAFNPNDPVHDVEEKARSIREVTGRLPMRVMIASALRERDPAAWAAMNDVQRRQAVGTARPQFRELVRLLH